VRKREIEVNIEREWKGKGRKREGVEKRKEGDS